MHLVEQISEQSSFPELITQTDENIVRFANRRFREELGTLATEPVGAPADTLIPVQSKDSPEAYTFLNHTWYRLDHTDFKIEGKEYRLYTLREREDVPNRKSLQGWKAMIRTMLHRFRSPLTGLSGFLYLMDMEQQDPLLSKRLKSVNKGIDHLNDIMDQLEKVYHIGTTHPEDEGQRSEPIIILRKLITEFREESGKNILLEQCPDSGEVEVPKHIVRAILRILLENAVVHGTGEEIRVSVQRNHYLNISVCNHLKERSEPLDKNIFRPFVTTSADRLGLGLTMALLYADQCSGTLFLKEDQGQKACLTFSMPV